MSQLLPVVCSSHLPLLTQSEVSTLHLLLLRSSFCLLSLPSPASLYSFTFRIIPKRAKKSPLSIPKSMSQLECSLQRCGINGIMLAEGREGDSAQEACRWETGQPCSSDVREGRESDAEDGTQRGVSKGSKNRQVKAVSKTKLRNIRRQEEERQRKCLVLQAFRNFYLVQYGERWPSLFSELQAESRSCCLVNGFAESEVFMQNVANVPNLTRLGFTTVPAYGCSGRFPHPERDSKNVYTYYLLDAASVLATEALEIHPGDSILDLCAAPGGKSLAILQQMGLPQGMLTANELSDDRRQRLLKVIADYVPRNLRQCVKVTGRDGTRWPESEVYDKVLVDAPCSSERHLLHDLEEMYRWTHKRSGNCAKRQLALLAAGLRSVQVGGLVVYSTCSISNLENDGVIAKV
eukprot:c25528_g1_i1 orf=156-1373(+)